MQSKGTLSLNAFSGKARCGSEYEYSVDRPLAEPDAAKNMAIARAPEDDTDHFKCVTFLGAKDEQRTLIDRVLSQKLNSGAEALCKTTCVLPIRIDVR